MDSKFLDDHEALVEALRCRICIELEEHDDPELVRALIALHCCLMNV